MNRRTFLTIGVSAFALPPLLSRCMAPKPIPGRMLGPNHRAGHWLRGPLPAEARQPPAESLSVEVLIVGGGVAGLSARRWLEKLNVKNVLLLELEQTVGGNAASGRNAVSAFPWGAHYLPIADLRNHELLDFLQDSGSITGFDEAGLPLYNEYHLCHDPEERLFINGHWQEGLVPTLGVPEADRQQIQQFFRLTETLKRAIGSDGLDAFAIPLDRSSADARYRDLDRQSFAEYLTAQGFTSPYLRWYLNYGCLDDYGIPLEQTSAWAGLHYFASRKGRSANAPSSAVLTWPEGNDFLVQQLRKQATSSIHSDTLVYAVEPTQEDTTGSVRVLARDLRANKNIAIEAQRVILATPVFVARRLLNTSEMPSRETPKDQFPTTTYHTPWLVANLTVDALPQGRGVPLCWDNVVYGAESVGYICANHQDLRDNLRRVITYYKPLADSTKTPADLRRRVYETTREQWLAEILTELEQAHPGIKNHVQDADVWVWGHGMAAPTPNLLWHSNRLQNVQPIGNRIFFAHTDYSGISIFEEAFYSGIRAAEATFATLDMHS